MEKMSVDELRNKLGNYTAPTGLYDKTKEMPFLGKISCNIDQLEAGSWQEIIIDYEVGASGIADGAWLKVTFKFYSDWALFQTSDPKAANYLSAEYQAGELVNGQSPATVQSLKVRFDQKGHERPFQKAVIVDVIDGYIKPGDHIIIRLGDRRKGGPGTRVQTFIEKDFRFRAYVDPLGTSRFAAVPGDIVFDVVAGRPASIEFSGSRLVRQHESPNLKLRIEDDWGNVCSGIEEKISVIGIQNQLPVYEAQLSTNSDSWCTLPLENINTSQPGEIEFQAKLPNNNSVPLSKFYLAIDKELSIPRVYYGDLHVHSDDTVGTNDTVYNLSYGKDVAALDVLGYTANDFQITEQRWKAAVALCRELSEEGQFVCYPGTEWCGNSCAGGDHNVVFLHDDEPEFPLDRSGNVCRSFEWNEEMQQDTIQAGAWPLEELYATYIHNPEGHLLMPHVGGRRCNLDWHHPELERLAEVESAWGHFPWLYEEAIQRGYKLGVTANGDEHRGRCGGGVPGTAVFGTRGGLTGIIAPALKRSDIGVALRARHTFATTGERLIALTRCGDYIQGDEFSMHSEAPIEYRFLGDAGWDEIAAYDHSGKILYRNMREEAGYSSKKLRIRWGGARIKDRYRWADWKGKITVHGAVINGFRPLGFEHKEENCWRDGQLSIGFTSDTYGDSDGIELDLSSINECSIFIEGTIDGYVKVGDPLKGNPFKHCPSFYMEVHSQELLDKGLVRHDLGGAELFIAVERMSDEPMPREVNGTLHVKPENGPHGFRPIYFVGRQVDDAKAWTSAMFIHFQ